MGNIKLIGSDNKRKEKSQVSGDIEILQDQLINEILHDKASKGDMSACTRI